MKSSDQDRVLVAKAARGDEAAFEKIIRKYRDPGVRFCYRFLNDHQLAEDMVQEGFINLFNSLDRYLEKNRFSTYFYKILTNLCIDSIRRRAKLSPPGAMRSEVTLSNMGEDIAESHDDAPCEKLISEEKAFRIRSLIDRLPDSQRNAVLMRDLKGFKYAEISRMMNCTMNKVKILIFRGRRNLQRILRSAAM